MRSGSASSVSVGKATFNSRRRFTAFWRTVPSAISGTRLIVYVILIIITWNNFWQRRVSVLMDRVEIVPDRKLGPYDEPDMAVRGRKGQVWLRHVPVPRG